MSDKLIWVAVFNTDLNILLGTEFQAFSIYRSKGLLTHLINRKHFIAAKYIDYLPEIIRSPDYAGYYDGKVELVKMFKDNIFISIKLDEKKHQYYVATMSFLHRLREQVAVLARLALLRHAENGQGAGLGADAAAHAI